MLRRKAEAPDINLKVLRTSMRFIDEGFNSRRSTSKPVFSPEFVSFQTDIQDLNALYKCGGPITPPTTPRPAPTTTPRPRPEPVTTPRPRPTTTTRPRPEPVTTTRPTIVTGCEDKFINCAIMAADGKCTAYDFMKTDCRRTCGYCDGECHKLRGSNTMEYSGNISRN